MHQGCKERRGQGSSISLEDTSQLPSFFALGSTSEKFLYLPIVHQAGDQTFGIVKGGTRGHLRSKAAVSEKGSACVEHGWSAKKTLKCWCWYSVGDGVGDVNTVPCLSQHITLQPCPVPAGTSLSNKVPPEVSVWLLREPSFSSPTPAAQVMVWCGDVGESGWQPAGNR